MKNRTPTSSWEKLFRRWLREKGVRYKRHVVPIPDQPRASFDFQLDKTKVLVDLNGHYWHKFRRRQNQKKYRAAVKLGYTVAQFTVYDKPRGAPRDTFLERATVFLQQYRTRTLKPWTLWDCHPPFPYVGDRSRIRPLAGNPNWEPDLDWLF